MKHTIFSANDTNELTAHMDHILDQANSIRLDTDGKPLSKILPTLSAKLIALGKPKQPVILSVENLNYGRYSTKQLKNIIEQITSTLAQLPEPAVDRIYWSGSRLTFLQLLMDHETHEMMSQNSPISGLKLHNEQAQDGFNIYSLEEEFDEAN